MALSREAELSIAASSRFPGFRFSPCDEELIQYYLTKKFQGNEKAVEVIVELDITKFEPWDLPDKSIIKSDDEWFFFSSRGKKYPNGSQSRRATETGYWKATGKERGVKTGSNVIGTKRTLVFHIGRAPKGERTEWIMHEYCMLGQDSLVICRLRRKKDFRGATGLNQEPSTSRPPMIIASASETENATTSKKSNYSDESQSVEQMKEVKDEELQQKSPTRLNVIDKSSISSDQKRDNKEIHAESSTHPNQSKAEDDCFADILNDNIIELDDLEIIDLSNSSIMNIPNQQQPQSSMWEGFPSQGTANRRIRLRKQKASITALSISGPYASKAEEARKQKASIIALSISGPYTSKAEEANRQRDRRRVSFVRISLKAYGKLNQLYVEIIMTMVLLFCFFLGVPWTSPRFVGFFPSSNAC